MAIKKLYVVPPFGAETEWIYQLVTEDGFGIVSTRSSGGGFGALGDLLTKHPERLWRLGRYLSDGFEVEMMTEAKNAEMMVVNREKFLSVESRREYMKAVLFYDDKDVADHESHAMKIH